MGFMGWIHWLAYRRVQGARVAAISTRSEQRLKGDWRGIQGNFGPPGEQVDLSGIATHARLDDLLANPEVDLVDITLPTSRHAEVAVRALEAGKHVLCEKPMALNLPECERMTAAARRSGRRLFVGHVLPFFPEYAWASDVIRSGRYGRALGGMFRRIISDPTWIADYWSAATIGGPMLDLHIHDAHFIRMMFGMPTEVQTTGRTRQGVPEFWHSQFRFEDAALTVEATSGTIGQQGRPFLHAFEIHLERATLAFEFSVLGGEGKYLCPPVLLDDHGQVHHPTLPGGDPVDAFAQELNEVCTCIGNDHDSEILGAGLAQDAIRLCEAQGQSLSRQKGSKPIRKEF